MSKIPELPLFWTPEYPLPELELLMEDLETWLMIIPEYPSPRIGTSHGELRNFTYDHPRIPPPLFPIFASHGNFVWWTGVWRLLLYHPRILSRFALCVIHDSFGNGFKVLRAKIDAVAVCCFEFSSLF